MGVLVVGVGLALAVVAVVLLLLRRKQQPRVADVETLEIIKCTPHYQAVQLQNKMPRTSVETSRAVAL